MSERDDIRELRAQPTAGEAELEESAFDFVSLGLLAAGVGLQAVNTVRDV